MEQDVEMKRCSMAGHVSGVVNSIARQVCACVTPAPFLGATSYDTRLLIDYFSSILLLVHHPTLHVEHDQQYPLA